MLRDAFYSQLFDNYQIDFLHVPNSRLIEVLQTRCAGVSEFLAEIIVHLWYSYSLFGDASCGWASTCLLTPYHTDVLDSGRLYGQSRVYCHGQKSSLKELTTWLRWQRASAATTSGASTISSSFHLASHMGAWKIHVSPSLLLASS